MIAISFCYASWGKPGVATVPLSVIGKSIAFLGIVSVCEISVINAEPSIERCFPVLTYHKPPMTYGN
jgi:hypothetical protein